nr:MAG TPA: hypothetical protein [Caudoviricetes sp.]
MTVSPYNIQKNMGKVSRYYSDSLAFCAKVCYYLGGDAG